MTAITVTRTVPGYRCDRCSAETASEPYGMLPSGWLQTRNNKRTVHVCYDCLSGEPAIRLLAVDSVRQLFDVGGVDADERDRLIVYARDGDIDDGSWLEQFFPKPGDETDD